LPLALVLSAFYQFPDLLGWRFSLQEVDSPRSGIFSHTPRLQEFGGVDLEYSPKITHYYGAL
jgi:hypothetical protein